MVCVVPATIDSPPFGESNSTGSAGSVMVFPWSLVSVFRGLAASDTLILRLLVKIFGTIHE